MVALFRKVVVALLLVLWLCPGTSAAGPPEIRAATAAAPPGTGPSASARPARRTPGTREEIDRYAQRERQAGGLEHFTAGGHIGGTEIIIILCLVIIIIILL
jgi:hypothetical protein